MEEWKYIPNTNNMYMISNHGRVKTFYDGNRSPNGIMKGNMQSLGYMRVKLYINEQSKSKYIHSLVANAFIPNPENLPDINHKDLDKTNNYVDNLERCTRKYNINHAMKIKGNWLLNSRINKKNPLQNIGVNI